MTINLTEKDNNGKINCQVNDWVVITLTWRPSSGFFWQEANTTAASLEEIKHEGEEETPGAPVTVIFKFKINKSGVIQLNMARPWDETQPPAKWFEVNVEVK